MPSTDKADKAHSFIKNRLGLGINFSQRIPLRSCHDFYRICIFFCRDTGTVGLFAQAVISPCDDRCRPSANTHKKNV